MRRRVALRRTPMRRGTRRVGQAARERVRAGGVLAEGRSSATLAQDRAFVAALRERCGFRCESPFCRRRGPLERHHVIKRSQGGADLDRDLAIMLCRDCHRATDRAFALGRLVVEALGDERFRVALETRDHKGAPLLSCRTTLYIRPR